MSYTDEITEIDSDKHFLSEEHSKAIISKITAPSETKWRDKMNVFCDIPSSNAFLTKGAFLLTPSYELSMERVASICEKMTFKGCFTLTKTATGILFKISNPNDYQAVYKKGFHKITGARFYRKIAIPCRPRNTFTLYVLEVPEDMPVEDIRYALYKYNSVVEVVRLHIHNNSKDQREEGIPANKVEATMKMDQLDIRDIPSTVIRITLASMDEYNTLLQNGLNFYDATFFPTEANIKFWGASIEHKRRMDGNISGRTREILPVFDAAGFCKIPPPKCKLIKPSRQ